MLADLRWFIDSCRAPDSPLDPDRPFRVARAPGRLDAFGGIIDYVGGTVCEMPLARAVRVALQPRADRLLRVSSRQAAALGLAPNVTIDLGGFLTQGQPIGYAEARERLTADPATAWAAYVAGAWLVLLREGWLAKLESGADLVIDSDLPIGAGVSSSAALEIATLQALTDSLGLTIPPATLARLGQRVENEVVGAPCGLMDQLTVTLGRADELLVIQCQPDRILERRRLPAGVCWGAIDTGVRHAVSGQPYTTARVAAFMGLTILGYDRFGGYLANVAPDEYRRTHRPRLPETIRGAEFLDRYGDHRDPVTRIRPEVTYPVAAACDHHVFENERTPRLLAHLAEFAAAGDRGELVAAGELLYASHDSYRDNVALGAPEADSLVAIAREFGPTAGAYGAKITGGGCGGSVGILGDELLPELLPEIGARYAAATGCRPTVLYGSSDGAAEVGSVEVTD